MVDRRSLAIGVLAVLVAVSGVTLDAQGRGGAGAAGGGGGAGRAGGPFTPEPGARDLKSVLFNWTWHMGMLRSGSESELIKTLYYEAEGGTIQVNGQPCAITKLRIYANYQIPGYRTPIECTLPNGQTYSNVEVLSEQYAWDEDIPGAELVPGEGTATPRPNTWEERWIRLWAGPHGAPKAALAGAAGLPPFESFGENPAALLDRQAAAGAKPTTTLTWQGDRAIVTFPIPGLAGATATATLNNYLPERVVVQHGANTTEFIYSGFSDWNNPLFKIEALYADSIVERRNGTVVREIKSKETEIGQIYVVVPVPESVRRAGPAVTARN